jgi:hypothetical protein
MTTRCGWAVGLALALAIGCGSEPRGFGVVAGVNGADRSLERACRLTERRCSRCHTLDRVINARVSDPADWEAYVSRMRRTPGSGILAQDQEPLLRCLLHHSFGAQVAR